MTISPERRAAFAADWNAGVSVTILAVRHDIRASNVYDAARRWGLPSRSTNAAWTDDRVAKLKELWLSGLSASQVARKLGGTTRNSVIGKVNRLGMAERTGDVRQKPSEPRRMAAPKPRPLPKVAAPKPALAAKAKPAAPIQPPAFKTANGRVYPMKPSKTLPIEFEPVAPNARTKVFASGAIVEPTPNKPVRKISGVTSASRLLPIMHPDFGGCRWPVGGEGSDTLFCCAARPNGSTYCETHRNASLAKPMSPAERTAMEAKMTAARAAKGLSHRYDGRAA
jgi:GcrA cell cycle regulator